MSRVKRPYYEAAKIVAKDKEQVCCLALEVVDPFAASLLRRNFNKLYLPDGSEDCSNYFGPIDGPTKEARILALLLAQEVADEGGFYV